MKRRKCTASNTLLSQSYLDLEQDNASDLTQSMWQQCVFQKESAMTETEQFFATFTGTL